jgi:hypothetical protein
LFVVHTGDDKSLPELIGLQQLLGWLPGLPLVLLTGASSGIGPEFNLGLLSTERVNIPANLIWGFNFVTKT